MNSKTVGSLVVALLAGGLFIWKPWINHSVPERIEQTGVAAASLTFSDWKATGNCMMEGKVRYNGDLPVSLTSFAAYAKGVKTEEGPVRFPSLRKGETGVASIFVAGCNLGDVDRIVIAVAP